ncbi:MAG: UbiA family prenyltransferase, partial [Patescibacteria group bacterium]
MKTNRIILYLKAFRVNQWIKNLVVFTAIIFSGQLFELQTFINTVYAFLVFCILSSASYLLNDIIDFPYDIKHPVKSKRPIAAGLITVPQATFIVFIMTLGSLILSILISIPFFLLSLGFILLHFFYS